ncbi:MAG: GNAT family protein [Burkholderiales bacterium]|nr:GNAT family protein [Burkholderiales bacterium]
MSQHLNSLGQPVGPALPGWKAPPVPPRETMHGRFCRMEPLDASRHTDELFEAYALDAEGRMWTYLSRGPFATRESYRAWMGGVCAGDDPLYYAIVDLATGKAIGVASYMRIDPANGCIEVGNLAFSPLLQKKPAATEAMYLMMKRAFDLGYRRYEWKCDTLNAPSRAAALRLGFAFEGIFRQAVIYKGRSRDTAWFSVLDQEWPALKDVFERWLEPANFDERGSQNIRLSVLSSGAVRRD